jgi:hypothetical protein
LERGRRKRKIGILKKIKDPVRQRVGNGHACSHCENIWRGKKDISPLVLNPAVFPPKNEVAVTVT